MPSFGTHNFSVGYTSNIFIWVFLWSLGHAKTVNMCPKDGHFFLYFSVSWGTVIYLNSTLGVKFQFSLTALSSVYVFSQYSFVLFWYEKDVLVRRSFFCVSNQPFYKHITKKKRRSSWRCYQSAVIWKSIIEDTSIFEWVGKLKVVWLCNSTLSNWYFLSFYKMCGSADQSMALIFVSTI